MLIYFLKKIIYCSLQYFIFSLLISYPFMALSYSVSTSFKVSEKVVPGCKIGEITPIDFGNICIADIKHGQLRSSGKIAVTCTPGVSAEIQLSGGQHPENNQRKMSTDTGDDFLSYSIYQDAAYTNPWQPDTKYKLDNFSDSEKLIPLYAKIINPAITLKRGHYSDMIDITITY